MLEEFLFELGIFLFALAGVAIKWWSGKDDTKPHDVLQEVSRLRDDVQAVRELMMTVNGKMLEIEGRQKIIGEQIRDQHAEILQTAHVIDNAVIHDGPASASAE